MSRYLTVTLHLELTEAVFINPSFDSSGGLLSDFIFTASQDMCESLIWLFQEPRLTKNNKSV